MEGAKDEGGGALSRTRRGGEREDASVLGVELVITESITSLYL